MYRDTCLSPFNASYNRKKWKKQGKTPESNKWKGRKEARKKGREIVFNSKRNCATNANHDCCCFRLHDCKRMHLSFDLHGESMTCHSHTILGIALWRETTVVYIFYEKCDRIVVAKPFGAVLSDLPSISCRHPTLKFTTILYISNKNTT